MQHIIARNLVVHHKDDPAKLPARVTRVSPFGHIAWTDVPIWGHDIHPTEDLIIVQMAQMETRGESLVPERAGT